jgi:ATP-binding cassette subfamily B protein
LRRTRRRFRVPEVIQTSALDCGPASLTALLSGYGVDTNHAHLRDVCQTDVDGTLIGTLEDVANQCGLDAEQVMLPFDHLMRREARALPAIVVVTVPSGNTHFVVVWRRLGPFVQIMDPIQGRLWRSITRLGRDLYQHTHPVSPEDFVEWFSSQESVELQHARLRDLGMRRAEIEQLMAGALAHGTWTACARLDGAIRAVAELAAARAIRRGAEAARLVAALAAPDGPPLPDRHMSAVAGDDGMVDLRGVVLVRVRGRRDGSADTGADASAATGVARAAHFRKPSEEGPARQLWRLVRAEPLAALVGIALLLVLAAGALVFESLVLRGLLAVIGELGATRIRAAAAAAVITLLVLLLVFDVAVKGLVAGVGRRLEIRLRVSFLGRLPHLKDRYFRTRLTSDLAQRAHSVHVIRILPEQLAGLLRAWAELVALGIAIVWLVPSSWLLVSATVLAGAGLPLVWQSRLRDGDMRARTHAGNLSRFFLDSLLGAAPIRAHRAQRAISREHESLLSDWLIAGRSFVAATVAVEVAVSVATLAPLAWLVGTELAARPVDGSALLLVYWAMLVPQRASAASVLLAQLPVARNTALRLAEPLASAEDPDDAAAAATASGVASPAAPAGEAVALELEGVDVSVGGHALLSHIDLVVPAGAHVAVVGRSGAGKSTLLGLLLGWYEPGDGRLLVDGAPLDSAGLERLRRRTAWVDPSIHLWMDSLFDNVLYGASAEGSTGLPAAVEDAELREVIEVLPDGLQARLGEGGRLLSGGQGQRVRLGRALIRRDAGLVLLDEPFRGLDRAARSRLCQRAREVWSAATLLYVTHDVSHALDFDRVVVLEGGRVVESGAPHALAADAGSRFAALVAAERAVRARLWGETAWRRIQIDRGAVSEELDV